MSAEPFPSFEHYFHDLWGFDPFPWQRRLAERVCEGKWPSPLSLPTSAGKTAAIDVAVYALASHANNAPRRIFFVVDRRIVVDEATERAEKIADALAKAAADSTLGCVASRLRAIGGTNDALIVAGLRGGILHDDAWCRNPAQPAVCCSTVDQLGSRLLFRGYGVRSPRSWPIHAALVANDSLIILDEAHCSTPFLDTLRRIADPAERPVYREWAREQVGGPLVLVEMSATPTRPPVPMLEADDHQNLTLRKRLFAEKWAALQLVATKRNEEHAIVALADEMAKAAVKLSAADGVKVVGIMVNRVATARMTHTALRKHSTKHGTGRALLFIGRSRPWDRDRLWNKESQWIKAGRKEQPAETIFVVSTQCLEVGADVDFDALVTECASLDALRQRFGRLNRLGEKSGSQAVIMIREDQLRSDDDPVYGSALKATWEWLTAQSASSEHQTVNFGIQALADVLPEDEKLRALCIPLRHAPVILPAHLDCWAQTSPEPVPSPAVSVFLHGVQRGAADVQVVWRADLTNSNRSQWQEIVAFCPPSAAEMLPLPFIGALTWLKQLPGASNHSDVEGEADTEPSDEDRAVVGRKVLRWRGADGDESPVNPDDICPGDTIIVPASYGGIDEFGWNPVLCEDDGVAVNWIDVGDAVTLRCRGRAILRLHPGVIAQWPDSAATLRLPAATLQGEFAAAFDSDEQESDALQDLLGRLSEQPELRAEIRDICAALKQDPHPKLEWMEDDEGQPHPAAIVGSRRLKQGNARLAESDFSTSSGRSTQTQRVELEPHLAGVAQKADAFAQLCGLPAPLAEVLRKAALYHDIGKSDPRFQAWLHGGNKLASLRSAPLAKSGKQTRSSRENERARDIAGYPRNARHELQSVALLERSDALPPLPVHRDLLLHLVASHHGWCRPFAPPVEDAAPVHVRYSAGGLICEATSKHELARVDSGVGKRFWCLTRHFGWWGLAWLETLLRLADHRQSEEEQRT